MKKTLSLEILTDYLFELLEDEERLKVEKQIRACPESQKKLKQLRLKFTQLQALEPKSSLKVKALLPTIICAASIILVFILQKPLPKNEYTSQSLQKIKSPTSVTKPHRIFQLEFFSVKNEGFSLLSKLDAPLKETIDLKIPEVRIQYDDENYKIVDLKTYQSLNLPSRFLEEQQDNYKQLLSLK